MSVINQMLRDLDKGQNLPKPGAEEVRAVSKPAKNFTLYWLLLIVVLLSMLGWSYQALPKLMRFLADDQAPLIVETSPVERKPSVNKKTVQPLKLESEEVSTESSLETSAKTRDSQSESVVEFSPLKQLSVQEASKPEPLQQDILPKIIELKEPVSKSISMISGEKTQVVTRSTAAEENVEITQPKDAEQRLSEKSNQQQPVMVEPENSQVTIASTTLSMNQKAQILWRQAGKQPNQAESLLAQALAIDENLVGARVDLIRLMISHGDLARAEFIVDQGLLTLNNDANLIEWKARLLIAQKRGDLAETWLLKAQPELLNHTSYYGLLAGLLNQHQKFDQSASWYQQLVGVEPQQGSWWLGLAIAYHKLSQLDLAQKAYQRALQAQGLSSRSKEYIQQKLQQLEALHGH